MLYEFAWKIAFWRLVRVDQDSFFYVLGKSSISMETILGGEASEVVEDSSV